MKQFKKIVAVTAFACIGCLTMGYGQTYGPDETPIEIEVTELNTTTPEIFGTLGINNTVNPRNQTITGNSIILQQIGDFNQVRVRTATESSEINIDQLGNDNFTSLEYRTNTAITNILQNGNNNTVRDYVYRPSEDVSLDIEQNGDGAYFERFGANSITRSLQLKQTSESPAIIIRSFN